jgi:small acid-soluble spore protein H (minor)
MNKNRAKEIASSPVMANVNYNGKPIYIDSVNEANGIANIHSLDNPKDRQQVSIQNLEER